MAGGPVREAAGDEVELARRVLALPPRPPRRPALFTSGALFGEPGIYPDGPAMAPAPGPAPERDRLALMAATTLTRLGAPPDAADRCLAPPPGTGVPVDPTIRVSMAILARTVAGPAVAAFPGRTTATSLSFGQPASPGRVVGPPSGKAGGGLGAGPRVVNRRYRAEHPALLAPSLAHDLLWSPERAGHAAEAMLHALAAMVHLQLVASQPSLAHLGTELCRRQNSLAITLLNSRRPGSDRIVLVAPDGPGTIPGGAPAMQTPDFWSVPFAAVADSPAPELAAEVFTPLLDGGSAGPGLPPPAPAFGFTEAYGRWFGERLGSSWLPPLDQLRASVALGLVGPAEIAEVAGDRGASTGLGVEEALAVWTDGP
jgi:hypothetical protein